MKKLYTFALVFAATLCTLSCEKEVEEAIAPEEENEETVRISIRGTLDKEATKTAYDADGKMTWVDKDKIALLTYQGSNYESQNWVSSTLETSLGDITENGRNAVFYGVVPYHQDNTKEWLSTGFAVYPVSLAQSNAGGNYYNAPYIKLPSSVTGLASSIALIGLPDSETLAEVTNFNFKTAMGVLKVTINGIPAETAALKLCSLDKDNYPVDGDFTLEKIGSVASIDFSNYQGWGNGYQAVDLSFDRYIGTRDFYFNIPAGTFPAGKLAIKLEKTDGTAIVTKTINKQLTITRNECLIVPELNVDVRPFVITEQGYAPKLCYSRTSTQKLRFDVYTEALTAENYANKGNWVLTNRFTNDNKGNYTIPTSSFTNTGTYYLNYIVYKSTESNDYVPNELTDESVLSYGSIPIYYLKSDTEKNAITAVEVSSTETSETYAGDNGGAAALWDGNPNTYWHSKYGSGPDVRDDVYGAYIDVTLTNTISKVFCVKYNVRHSGNAQRPYKIVFGFSTDGSNYNRIDGYDTSTTEMKNAAAGAQVTLPCVVIPASCKYLRIGIAESAQGVINSSSSNHYAAMAELEVYSY